jgi:FkbM family methyltransferase
VRLFGYKVSIHFKLKRIDPNPPYKIDTAIQKRVLGSHSQYLEDIFIDSVFRGKTAGTYVDIGANDPSELSNTKRFYDRGWTGVNIEPDVRVYRKLCAARPRDTNLNVGVGNRAGELIFYELSPNTLSTFNKASAQESVRKEGAVIVSETPVKVITLAELLREYSADGAVDFMSVDAEGYEMEILTSNDWGTFRPTAIIVEVNQDKTGQIANLMKGNGYILVYHNGTNGIFVDGTAGLIRRHLADQ